METLFSFLIYLFEDKHLAVTTVMAYKAGLTAPLFYRFGIDFIIEVVTSLLQSFALQRPAPERLPITWSVNKCLDFYQPLNSEDPIQPQSHATKGDLDCISIRSSY